MALRRWHFALVAGVVFLVGGVIGLLGPVSTSDGNGDTIGCGNGISADLSQARAANDKRVVSRQMLYELVPPTDYVTQCQTSVSQRRRSTIPLTVVGVLVAAGSLVVGGRVGSTAQGR
jgi:hypothetical protein